MSLPQCKRLQKCQIFGFLEEKLVKKGEKYKVQWQEKPIWDEKKSTKKKAPVHDERKTTKLEKPSSLWKVQSTMSEKPSSEWESSWAMSMKRKVQKLQFRMKRKYSNFSSE